MEQPNFQRLAALAESIFDAKNDPNQLVVNDEVLNHLFEIHPSTASEYSTTDGPAAWVIVIPTTKQLMDQFLKKEISEKELYAQTPLNCNYECIYLCSALVLEEYQKKGMATELVMKAIEAIRKSNKISSLFVWAYTEEGNQASESIAIKAQLPLFKRLD